MPFLRPFRRSITNDKETNNRSGTHQRTLNNGRARTDDPASAAAPRRPVPADGVKHRAGAIAATLLDRLDPAATRGGCQRGKQLAEGGMGKDTDERLGWRA